MVIGVQPVFWDLGVSTPRLSNYLDYVSKGEGGASEAVYSVNNQEYREYKYVDGGIPSPTGSYVCTADVSTLGAFDVDLEVRGDWGTVTSRVQVPAKLPGSSQEEEPFIYDLEGSPAVVRLLGKVMDNTGQAQTLFAGLLSDNKLLAADASFRMGRGVTGFEFAAVLKEGITAGTVRLQSALNTNAGILYGWKDYLISGASSGIIAVSTGNLLLGERTVGFTGVLKNALNNVAIPGEVVISSPQAGELCRTNVMWQTTSTSLDKPDGTFTCVATIKQFGNIDLIYQAKGAWGDSAAAVRSVLPASQSAVTQDVLVNAPVVRVSGVIKNRLGNLVKDAAVTIPSTGESFDPLFMTNGRNTVTSKSDGTYTIDLLLKAGQTTGQFETQAALEGVNSGFGAVIVGYANALPTAKLPVTANVEISSGRVVKFVGQALNGHLNNAPLRGRVVIKHVSGTEICATQVEISGQYSCTVVLESAAAFTVVHTLSGDWGEASTAPLAVPEGKANTISQDIEGFPTTIAVTGRVRDTGDVQVSGGAVSLLGDTGFLSSVSTSEYQTGLRGEYRLVLVLKPNSPRARLEVLARYFKAEGKNLIDIQNVQSGEFKTLNLDLLVARPVQISGVISNRFVPTMPLSGVVRAKLSDGTFLCETIAAADGKFSCFGRVTTSGAVQANYTVESFWGGAMQSATIPAGHAYNTSESTQDLSLPATTLKFVGKLVDTATNGAPYRGKVKISFASSSVSTLPLELDADNTTGAYSGYAIAPANQPISVLWQARDTANNVGVKTLGVTAAANVVTEVSADLRLETRNPGTARWANLTGGQFLAAPAIGPDGTLYYLGVVSGTILRLHAVAIDGSPRWELNVGTVSLGITQHSAPMVGSDGTIYVAHMGEAVAVRPDASIRWRYVFDANRSASGAFAATRDGIVLVKNTPNSTLILLNSNGVVQKTIDFGATYAGNLAIGTDQTIYLGVDQQLRAFNADGSPRWKVDKSAPLAIGTSGELYLPNNGRLQVVSANLKPLWEASFAPLQVVVGTSDQIYALNSSQIISLRSDGTTRWITTTASGTQFESLTIGNDNLLYVVAKKFDTNTNTTSGLVIAYKPDGTEAWRFSSVAPMNQISMGVDGTVYAGGDKLYAINSTATAPASGPWIQRFAGIANQNTTPLKSDPKRLIKFFGVVNNANLTSQVLENYKVQLTRADGTLFCNAVTDALGRYECTASTDLNALTLQLDFQGTYGNSQKSLNVEAGTADTVLSVQQDAAIAVTTLVVAGQVLDSEQKPIVNANVQFTGQITDAKTTDAKGSFAGVYLFAPTQPRVQANIEANDGVATVSVPFEVILTPKGLTRSEPTVTINRFAPGVSRWRTKLPGNILGYPVTNPDGTTYVVTDTAKLIEVKGNGQLGWTVTLSAPSSFAPTIAPDGTVYVTVGTILEAYTPTGTLKWQYSANTAFTTSVALDHTDRPVLATRDSITALETTGTLRWKFNTTEEPKQLAIGGDNTVYALNSYGLLRAVSPTGQARWTRVGTGDQLAIAATGYPVFIFGNTVVWLDAYGDNARVVSVPDIANKALVALKDGRVGVITANQVIFINLANVTQTINVVADGLAVGSDNVVYALHKQQIRGFTPLGTEAWRAPSDPDLRPIPSVSNGQLIAVVARDSLMALNVSSQGLVAGWSRFGANQANSNRTEAQAAIVGRTLKFTGNVTNQFDVTQKLVGFDIEIRDSSNHLLCRTVSDLIGNYSCVSPVVPTTAISTKYAISKRWSDLEFDAGQQIGAVAAGANGDETSVVQPLTSPLTTVRVFGVVKNGDGAILGGATITIQPQGSNELRVTAAANGQYNAYFSFRPNVGLTQFMASAVNGTERANLQFELSPVSKEQTSKELNITIGDRTGGTLRWTVPSTNNDGESNIVLDSADSVYLNSGVYTTAGTRQSNYVGNPMVVSSAGILSSGLALARADGTLRWNLAKTVVSAAPSNDGFHVIAVNPEQQYSYLNVSGDGVIRESTAFDNGWKVLGSPIVYADGTALVVVVSPTGILNYHRFNADGTPQMVYQVAISLAPNANELANLIFQQPTPTSDNGLLLYSKTNTGINLVKTSLSGTLVWSVPLAVLPTAVPTIAFDDAIYIAAGTNLLVFEPSGQSRRVINVQPSLGSSYSIMNLQGIALGQDQSIFLTLKATGKMSLLALTTNGEKRWNYERLCNSDPQIPSLKARAIRIALDGTVLTTLCADVVAVTSATLGLAPTKWAAFGRDNQNSSRFAGDGVNRRTIRITGKLKNANLQTHLFPAQKVTVKDESNQLICQVYSDSQGTYRCGLDTTNRNALAWTIQVDDQFGAVSQVVNVAAGDFNTRTVLEQDLLIPAKTLMLSGTLKLADGNLAVGKVVTFQLGTDALQQTTSGNDGRYAFTFVYPKNRATVTPELRFSEAGQDAIAKPLIELTPLITTTFTQDLQLGVQAAGTERWKIALPSVSELALSPNGTSRVISNGYLRAYNPEGSLLWQSSDFIGGATIALDSDGLTYVASSGFWRVINPNGSNKFTKTNLPISSPLGMTQNTARGFIVAYASTLVSIDRHAVEQWRYQLNTGNFTTAPIALANGNIAIGTTQSVVIVNTSGSLVSSLATPLVQSLISYGDSLIFGAGSAIRSIQGATQVWNFNSNTSILTNIVVDRDGVVYFTEGNNVVALNKEGQLRWRKDVGMEAGALSIGQDGVLHIVGRTALLSLNPDGSFRWNSPSPNPNLTVSPVIASDGTIIFSTQTHLVASYTDSRGLATTWARRNGNNANTNSFLINAPLNLPRIVKFRGIVSNRFIPNSRLGGYDIDVSTSDNQALCNTKTDTNGVYECSALLDLTATNIKYLIRGTLTTTNFSGVVPAGSIALEQTVNLDAPITTLKIEGSVQDVQVPPQAIANASIAIASLNLTTTTNAAGQYTFYLPFADGVAQTNLQLITTFAGNSSSTPVNQALTANVLNSATRDFVMDNRVLGAVSRSIDLGGTIIGSPVIGANNVIYVGSAQGIHALNPDGTIRWLFSARRPNAQIRLASDQTVVFSDGSNVIKLQADGTQDWLASGRYDVLAVAADGTIYTKTRVQLPTGISFKVTALALDGNLKWVSSLAIEPSVAAIGADGGLIVADYNKLAVLNPNGSVRWIKTTQNYFYMPALTLSDTRIWLTNSNGYGLTIAYDYAGEQIWTSSVLNPDNRTSSVTIDQLGISHFTHTDKLRSIDSNGVQQSQITIPNVSSSAPTIGDDDVIYVTTNTGVVAVGSNQQIKWTYVGTGEPVGIMPVLGRSVLVSQGQKLNWVNATSSALKSNAVWASQNQDRTGSRRMNSDGIARRYIEFNGKVTHAFIPDFTMQNTNVVVKQGSEIICISTTSSSGEYSCGGPTQNLNALAVTMETLNEFGSRTASVNVAAGTVNTVTTTTTNLMLSPTTVRITGQITNSSQQPVGGLVVRLLDSPQGAIATKPDGTPIAPQWSSLDSANATLVQGDTNGLFEVWVTLPSVYTAANLVLKTLDPNSGATARVTVQQNLNSAVLNTIAVPMTLQQTAQRIYGRIATPNNQAFANTLVRIQTTVIVQANDAVGQSLGTGYDFNVQSDANGDYAVTLNYLSETTSDVQTTITAAIVGNSVNEIVTSTLQSGIVTQTQKNFTFDNTAIGVSRWRLAIPQGNFQTTPALGSDSTVYLTQGNMLIAVQPNGVEKWRRQIAPSCYVPAIVPSNPTIRDDGVILVVGWCSNNSRGSTLQAFDSIGTELWSYEVPATLGSQLALGPNSVVYVAVNSPNNLIAISSSGQELWSIPVTLEYGVQSKLLIGPDQTIYVIGFDGSNYGSSTITAVNQDGSVRWRKQFDLGFHSAALGNDGTLFVAGSKSGYNVIPVGKLFAISAPGNTIWEKSIGYNGGNGANTLLILPNNQILLTRYANSTIFNSSGVEQQNLDSGGYAVANDARIYGNTANATTAMSLSNVIQWSFPKTGQGAIGTNMLYLKANNELLGINIGATGLANTSWASEYKDQKNSSRTPLDGRTRRLVKLTGAIKQAANNLPVSNGSVVVRYSNGDPFCNTLSDSDGNYDCAAPIEDMAGFSLEARVVESPYGTASTSVQIPVGSSGVTTTISLDFSVALARIRLKGTITDAATPPNPIGGVVVQVTGDISGNTTTDSTGAYSLLLYVSRASVALEMRVNDPTNQQVRSLSISPPAGLTTERIENFQFDQTAIGNGRWAYQTTENLDRSTPAIDSSGNIYITSTSGKLISLTANGQQRWIKSLQGSVGTPVIGITGTIFVADTQKLYAFDAFGVELWSQSLQNDGEAKLALTPSGAVIALSNTQIRRFSANGSLEWNQPVDSSNSYQSSSPVTLSGDKILFCRSVNYQQKMYALNADGSLAWESIIDCSSEIALSNTTAFVTKQGSLTAVNIVDGQSIWVYQGTSSARGS